MKATLQWPSSVRSAGPPACRAGEGYGFENHQEDISNICPILTRAATIALSLWLQLGLEVAHTCVSLTGTVTPEYSTPS